MFVIKLQTNMGQYISMLFGYDEVEYTELPQDTSNKLTKDVFKDISKFLNVIVVAFGGLIFQQGTMLLAL